MSNDDPRRRSPDLTGASERVLRLMLRAQHGELQRTDLTDLDTDERQQAASLMEQWAANLRAVTAESLAALEESVRPLRQYSGAAAAAEYEQEIEAARARQAEQEHHLAVLMETVYSVLGVPQRPG
jgi:hypothetical protein